MGVLQNANREFCGVFRIWGGTVLNSAYPQETVGNWHLTGMQRNLTAGEGITDDKVGVPIGLAHPAAWIMPGTAGMVASQNEATGTGTMTGAGALGKNGASDLTGTGTVDATAQLVVSGTAALAGTGTVSANVVAALAAAASLSATGNQTGAITALGWAASSLTGTGALTGTRYATGELAADILPYTELSPQTLAAEVWSALAADYNEANTMGELLNSAGAAADPLLGVVEGAYTLRDALRLLLAVAQGDADGLTSGSPVFKSIDGTKDRVVATVSGGSRSVSSRDVT